MGWSRMLLCCEQLSYVLACTQAQANTIDVAASLKGLVPITPYYRCQVISVCSRIAA